MAQSLLIQQLRQILINQDQCKQLKVRPNSFCSLAIHGEAVREIIVIDYVCFVKI